MGSREGALHAEGEAFLRSLACSALMPKPHPTHLFLYRQFGAHFQRVSLYPAPGAKEALCGLLWEVTLDPPGPGLGPSPTTPNLGPYHSAPLSISPSGAMARRDAVSSTGSQQTAPGTSRCLLDSY